MLQQAVTRAQRAEDEVRALRILLRDRDDGYTLNSVTAIPSNISIADQIRHGTQNSEILINLLRANYMDLNGVASRLERQNPIHNPSPQSSAEPSDTTDDNVT